MCQIDASKGTESLVALKQEVWEILRKFSRGGVFRPPSAPRGLTVLICLSDGSESYSTEKRDPSDATTDYETLIVLTFGQ